MNAATCLEPVTTRLDVEALQRLLSATLGAGTGVACSGVDGDPQQLWPTERAAVGQAVPRRQKEFASGRIAARQALSQIGCLPEAIPCAPDRSPIWPAGATGSIAHNGRVCVAIATHQNRHQFMGLDLEDESAMDPALWDTICTPGELSSLSSLPPHERPSRVTRIFCAKEAFYKWQYPQTRRLLDFQDVAIELAPDASRFHARGTSQSIHPLPRCQQGGRFLSTQGLLLAWLIGAPA
ncbi:MAG: 4'-phosphopantetheinyl transferase superfamily protein [Burkholderiaceae bacterium]